MATRTKPRGCCAPAPVRGLSEKKLDSLARVAKALSDPTRIEVLRFIAGQRGSVCACDVVDRFELSQPTMSHHLKALRDAGLIRGKRSGLWMMYDIDDRGADRLQTLGELLD